MEVDAVMTSPVTTCSPSTPMWTVSRLMTDRGVDCVVVVTGDDELVGVVTDRDLALRAIAEGWTDDAPVDQAMTRDVACTLLGTDVHDAAATMMRHRVRRLPVVDANGRVRGLVALDDVRLALARQGGSVAPPLEPVHPGSPTRTATADAPGDEPRVLDAMTRPVLSIDEQAPLSAVIDTMVDRGVGCLPVVDGHERVIGIVTDTDLIVSEAFSPLPTTASPLLDQILRSHRNRWRQKAGGAVASDIMTAPAATASPEEPLRAATARMITMGRRHLPVVESNGRLVGVLSQRDVLRLLHRDVELRRAAGDTSSDDAAS